MPILNTEIAHWTLIRLCLLVSCFGISSGINSRRQVIPLGTSLVSFCSVVRRRQDAVDPSHASVGPLSF